MICWGTRCEECRFSQSCGRATHQQGLCLLNYFFRGNVFFDIPLVLPMIASSATVPTRLLHPSFLLTQPCQFLQTKRAWHCILLHTWLHFLALDFLPNLQKRKICKTCSITLGNILEQILSESKWVNP
jgi:hypothetical protein